MRHPNKMGATRFPALSVGPTQVSYDKACDACWAKHKRFSNVKIEGSGRVSMGGAPPGSSADDVVMPDGSISHDELMMRAAEAAMMQQQAVAAAGGGDSAALMTLGEPPSMVAPIPAAMAQRVGVGAGVDAGVVPEGEPKSGEVPTTRFAATTSPHLMR